MKADSALAKLGSMITSGETRLALAVARTQGASYTYAWQRIITKPDFRTTRNPVRIDVTYAPGTGYQVYITPCSAGSVIGREGLIGGRVPL